MFRFSPLLKGRANRILPSVLDAIGDTPCVRLNKVPQMHGLECEVVAKLEFMNPGGSVKDRIGRQMVLDAEKEGILKKGSVLVEATSGNTGIGLSMAAAAKDYRMIITMPKKMSHEKEVTLHRLGAEVIRTETSLPYDHPDSLIGIAKRLRDEKGYILLDQYYNKSNYEAHYKTGQEIYDQCGGKLDMVVISTGTGGTMTGVSKRLKELLPAVKVVGVDPYGSILADPDTPAEPIAYQVEGIGYDFVPGVCHREYVDQWIKTRDQESFDLARELQRHEGLLVGGSCGSAMQGVLEAAKGLGKDKRVVVIFPDSIRNYMAKFADDNWMIEKGFMQGEVERPTYDSLKEEVEKLKAEIADLKKGKK
ncbi:cystathionine beta-synthase [Angomonas deanei]|uniref:cystathionine beta-synthase n=1 Tax=Angomonas deanei TaxID=59799 RepID=S9WR07_9TRYP|nr:cystathionine beta-synthase [Angomonas deanei]EPY40351.1 cystathionine beta-synthase [Angomonas deanei]CAD2221754.1 Pyridoxal-phosphate dependent enzyme, putative [Angomonas deanei]|eukprot:EPY38380.1 cystathionine beta-synthase [Angomonas deanei]